MNVLALDSQAGDVRLYKSTNADTCRDRRHGAGTHIACDTAACGEGTENEADVVERSLCIAG